MKITVLSQKWLQPLKAYFIAHRYEHDESYLYEEDLEAFIVDSKENPTWLYIIDGSIRGVLSFMMTDYFLKGHKTRIRMFYTAKKVMRKAMKNYGRKFQGMALIWTMLRCLFQEKEQLL